MSTNEQEIASLSTDIKYIVKAIDELKLDFKEFKEDVSTNYAKKKTTDDLKKKFEWVSRTFVGSVISIITSVIVYYVTKK